MMMRHGIGIVFLLVCVAPIGAIAGNFETLVNEEGVYTLVNLHPDEGRAKLYAVNYQQSGLIPLCSVVRITSLKRSNMTFEVEKTGRVYTYKYHKAAAEPFPQHLSRFFGKKCPKGAVSKLSEIDQEGIRQGRVKVGMTRQGVIYALGHPPRHVNSDQNAVRWRYWKNRFRTMMVHFDSDDRVSAVDG